MEKPHIHQSVEELQAEHDRLILESREEKLTAEQQERIAIHLGRISFEMNIKQQGY